MESLSERLKDVPCGVVRLDFDSFPEPEQQLFRKIWEIHEKHGRDLPPDVAEANSEFIFKALEIISWRVTKLFTFVIKEVLDDEIKAWYFDLHFFNFLEDLKECLANVRGWSEKDREEFLNDMKQSGMLNKVFRIPSRINEHDTKKVRSRKKAKAND